ncbi:hypothetical protein C8R46DRAFT_1059433 [Mycena filopes]|nr:hypothetical protein C8R46DRAFT_1059433 [Mycena filopes]
MSTAQTNVLSAPELLELILAHLPMRDLLVVAPRVSKGWNAVTLTPTVQRALFLTPDPTTLSTAPVRNPLLMEIFPPFFAAQAYRWSGAGTADPIMKMPWSRAPEAFRRADASWRRMLVMQPPAETLLVTELCNAQLGDFRRAAQVQCADGLRMGELYDIAVPLIDRAVSSFHVRWPGHDGVDCTNELTLSVFYVVQCCRRPPPLDKKFYGEEIRTKVDLGAQKRVPRGYQD